MSFNPALTGSDTVTENELQSAEDSLRTHYQHILPEGLRLVERLGTGARFGDLFLAEDVRGGTRPPLVRAVRFVPPYDPGTDSDAWSKWPNWKDKFLEPLTSVSGQQIPRIALPVDVARHGSGVVYVVGPHHEQSLAQLLAARPAHITPELAGTIVGQLLEGVAGLHARKLPHGDIRPGNIYVDEVPGGRGLLVTWIGDPILGALQFRSGNHLCVPDREPYYRVDLKDDAPLDALLNADLYALARTACDLALPNVDDVLEECHRASSPDKLWAACNHALRKGGPADVGWTDWLKGYFRGEYLLRRHLTTTIAILLGEPPPRNRLWSWLMTWLVPGAKAPVDAVEVIGRLRTYDHGREMTKHRRLAASALALVLFGLAFALAVVWGRGQDAVRQQAEDAIAGVEAHLARANGEIAARDSELDLRHTLDEKEESDRNRILNSIDERLETILAKMPRKSDAPAPPKVDKKRLARSKAEHAWHTAFGDQPKGPSSSAPRYGKDLAQNLYEKWRKKDGQVADWIKEWKQGQNGNGGCDELLRLAKPWKDSELNRLHEEACARPWDHLDKANRRLNNLRAAARLWEQCAKPTSNPRDVIATTKGEVNEILNGWYQTIITTSSWQLQLETGETALPANLGTNRRVTVYAASTMEGKDHSWIEDERPNPVFESRLKYEDNKSPLGTMEINWQPGVDIRLLLEGEAGWGTFGARPNLIDAPFDGPLAIWAFDQAQVVTSADGTTTLSYRVIGCPGPPRGWNVNRAIKKKITKAVKELQNGETAK